MNWSSPIPAQPEHARLVPTGPIVYRTRVFLADGTAPRAVRRFWKDDLEGQLAIGQSVTGQARFLEMTNAMVGDTYGRSSSTGRHYKDWFGYADCTVEHVRYEWIDLRPAIDLFSARLGARANPSRVAQAAELLLLYAYRYNYGDLPPCNQSDPNYNAVWDWMKSTLMIAPKYDDRDRLNIPLLDLPGVPPISWDEAVKLGRSS